MHLCTLIAAARKPLNDGLGWSRIVTPKRKDCD